MQISAKQWRQQSRAPKRIKAQVVSMACAEKSKAKDRYSIFKKKWIQEAEEISAIAFERRWGELLKEFKLESNKFMARAYKFRGMWAKPYFMNIFCAGMTSTQRSESANHMLKRFIQRSAPMHVFVSKFRDFQFARNQEEEKENHVTKQVMRKWMVCTS